MSERNVVLVTGGRAYANPTRVATTLSALHAVLPITAVVDGGCKTGADAFAREWARRWKVDSLTFYARWDLYGKGAGPRRNAEMIATAKPDSALVFAGGDGTHDCLTRIQKAGIPYTDVDQWWEKATEVSP